MENRDGTATVPPMRRLGFRVTLPYGLGAVAYGVKDFAFSTFLLLFYNQVLGLPAASVGFAIMCALLVDAVVDPAIGYLSDHTRSRWGRRHPWMYASAFPILLFWLLLWNPPHWSEPALLLWVFVHSVLVRSAISSYEVPSQALCPELSADYDERTRVTAYRFLFGWAGGMVMLVLTYMVFLAPTPEYPNGLLNPHGYPLFALGGGMLMFAAILISAIGTHREIRRLPRVDVPRGTLRESFSELLATIRNPAFAVLMAAGLCFYTAQGVSYALSNYTYSYVWQFEGMAFALLGAVMFLGAFIAFFLASWLGRRMGKPAAAKLTMALTGIALAAPLVLRAADLFPAPGDPAMLPLLFVIYVFNTMFSVSSTILGASMMADVVEHSEEETSRRSEGVFFAGAFFVQKCTSGIGVFVAGVILSLSDFPKNAAPGAVPEAALDRLMLSYALLYLALTFAAAWLYGRFPFGRAEHEARVRALAHETAREQGGE